LSSYEFDFHHPSSLGDRNNCKKTESAIPETQFEWGKSSPNEIGSNKFYEQAFAETDFTTACNIIREHCPRDYALYGSAIEKNFTKHFSNEKPLSQIGRIFNLPKLPQELLKTKSIVVSGISNAGKTSWCISHFENCEVISHMDDLKKIKPTTNGLVFDDMCFSHHPIGSNIHLVDLGFILINRIVGFF
jgi:hypothetical protein